MSGRELGSLVLVSFLLVGGFYYAKFSYLNATARSQLAQVSQAAPASSAGVRTICDAGETITINVSAEGVKSATACDAKRANSCQVIVNAPDNKRVEVDYCCRPQDGKCYCRVDNTPCPAITTDPATLQPYKAICARKNTSQKSGMVNPASQLAQAIVPCKSGEAADLVKKFTPKSPPAPGTIPDSQPPKVNTPTPAPVAQAPAPARPVDTAFNQPPTATDPQPVQTQQKTGSPTYAEIQAEGAKGGTGPGQTGQQTFPGQTQTAPGGPAFQQDAVYRPGYRNPSGELAGDRPGYYSPSRAQNTFGGTGFSGSRSGARVASSFISGFASLIGGLFSVSTNNVVNYVQSFVGGAPQQAPANQNSGQPQNYAPGQQVVIIVPYPMPTSRSGNTLAQLPPPPTSTRDAYADLRALANQEDGTPDKFISSGVQDDLVTSAFSEQERAGAAPAGNANANSRSGTVPAGRDGGLFGNGLQMGTTSVAAGEATSTHATSTSYKEPRVVEVGIPVDITDLGSYESLIAYLNGNWARTERTVLQNKVALAQAEVQQEAIRAQIEALQDARAADLCDDSCAASLTVLQNELPVMQSRVEELETAIRKDAEPRPSSPPPTVAQINRVVESLADPEYKAPPPSSAADAPTAASVYEEKALPELPPSKSEAIVTRVVQSIWNFLKSLFLPPATQASQPRPSCSLFASLFGKCK